MRKTFLLALIIGAAALLLLLLAPASTTPLSHSARNLLGSLRPTSQDPSVEQSPSVPPVPSIPPVPAIPPIHVHVDPPEIGPVEVDIDSQEIEQAPMEHDDAEHEDADHEDVDHVEIDHDDPDFKENLEHARKDVTHDITEQPDSLKLYVNGPFRCDCHDCNRSLNHDAYIVKMDFQLQVPRDIDIKIKTVNEGRVSVRDIN